MRISIARQRVAAIGALSPDRTDALEAAWREGCYLDHRADAAGCCGAHGDGRRTDRDRHAVALVLRLLVKAREVVEIRLDARRIFYDALGGLD